MQSHHMNQSVRHRQRGLTLVESLVSLVIYLIILGSIAAVLSYGPRQTQQAAAATQLKALGPAVDAYVKSNYAVIEATATPTNAYILPIATLIAQNYLPANFNATNPYGQTYTLYVLQPTAGSLLSLVLGSGGTVYTGTQFQKHMADIVIPGAAAMAGAAGGFVTTADVPGYVYGMVRGSYGGWQIDLTPTNIPNPGPLHLAYMQYFNQGTLASDYLYRFAIPGQPQLNEMFTDLNMGNNNVNNANNIAANGNIGSAGISPTGPVPVGVGAGERTWDMYAQNGVYVGKDALNNPQVAINNGNVAAEGDVTAENGNVALSHATTYETLVSDGSSVPIPTYCPGGTNPQIFVTPVYVSSGVSSLPLAAYQGWATVAGLNWTVSLRVLTQNGWSSPPSPFLVAKAIVKCG